MVNSVIKFINNRKPSLAAGEYKIAIQSQFKGTKDGGEISLLTPSKEVNFTVSHPHFSLNKEDILQIYPEDGMSGDFSSSLPHIIFKQPTLPWQAVVTSGSNESSWLALLLFHEGEDVEEITGLDFTSLNTLYGIDVSSDPNAANENIKIIKYPKTLNIIHSNLNNTLKIEDLKYLSHVRVIGKEQAENPNTYNEVDANSAIIGNRIPKEGINTAYLVALDKASIKNADSNEDSNYFIYLQKWQFSSYANQDYSYFVKSNFSSVDPERINSFKVNGQFGLHSDLEDQGYVLLDYNFRQGSKIKAIYRSPLIPIDKSYSMTDITNQSLPINNSSKLIKKVFNHDVNLDIPDVSYSSAWELGKFLALGNSDFSDSLFNIRHTYRKQELMIDEKHHFPRSNPQIDLADINNIQSFVDNIKLLQGVPFNYLIANSDLLPDDSIRFFKIDNAWLRALLEGAFSIGRHIKLDPIKYESQYNLINPGSYINNLSDEYSGFILRSPIVNQWKDVNIEAIQGSGNQLELKAQRYPSSDIMLCLFKGLADKFIVHQKKNLLHFGMQDYLSFADSSTGIVNIASLTSSLSVTNADGFAQKMIEDVKKLEFNI